MVFIQYEIHEPWLQEKMEIMVSLLMRHIHIFRKLVEDNTIRKFQ